MPGRLIDQPLDDVDRLGKARPAGDADRRGVGQHRRNLQIYRRNAVDRSRQMDILEGLHPTGADHIGADIGDAADSQPEKASLRVERQCGLRQMVARLMVGEKHLATGGDPLDRPANPPSRPERQYVLGIDEVLGPKPATDIGRDESHRRRSNTSARAVLSRVVWMLWLEI